MEEGIYLIDTGNIGLGIVLVEFNEWRPEVRNSYLNIRMWREGKWSPWTSASNLIIEQHWKLLKDQNLINFYKAIL